MPAKKEPRLYTEALNRFRRLMSGAHRTALREPTAGTLSTVDPRGRPSSRTVLVKNTRTSDLVFFTNLSSRKALHLVNNPYAALCFYWQTLDEQVLIEGKVGKVSAKEADAYWATRPRKSQIAAWASLQSKPLENRQALNARVLKYGVRFAVGKVPRPSNWSGYCIQPNRIEFWKRGLFRLHKRVLYEKRGNKWKKRLLYP